MNVILRPTTVAGKFYQDFIFDFEDQAQAFYNAMSDYHHSKKWFNVGSCKVTLLVEVAQ